MIKLLTPLFLFATTAWSAVDDLTLYYEQVRGKYWPESFETREAPRAYRSTFSIKVEGNEIPLRVTWDAVTIDKECHRVRDVLLQRTGGTADVFLYEASAERLGMCTRQPNGVLSERVTFKVKWKYKTPSGGEMTSGGPVVEVNSEGGVRFLQ